MYKRSVFVIVLLLISMSLFSQSNKSRLAVLPFDANNISETDADTITSLFETGLVNTDTYNIIEQREVKKILEAQKYSISGVTDEEYAVEIGKLLSAEQVAIGKVARVGSKYIINAKIVDVERGYNLNAKSVESDSLDSMPQNARLLAFKIAGLTIPSEDGGEEIASTFSELFVTTEPDEADIYINGVNRGKSPIVIDNVPTGNILVEAKKGRFYKSKNVKVVQGETEKVQLNLDISVGNIFIKSEKEGLKLRIDGEPFHYGEGFVEDIPIGTHIIEVFYNNSEGITSSYYRSEVVIEKNKTFSIEPDLKPVGMFKVIIPERAQGKITGSDNQVLLLNKTSVYQYVPLGDYVLEVWGDIFNDYQETFTVEQGDMSLIEPKLSYTKNYFERKYAKEYERLIESVANEVDSKAVEDIKKLKIYLTNSRYEFPQLLNKVNSLLNEAEDQLHLNRLTDRAKALRDEIEKLESEKERLILNKTRAKRRSIFSYVASGIGFGSMGATLYLGAEEYSTYKNATITSVAEESWQKVKMYDTLSYIGGGIGVLGIVSAIFFNSKAPSIEAVNKEIQAHNSKLAETKAKMVEVD